MVSQIFPHEFIQKWLKECILINISTYMLLEQGVIEGELGGGENKVKKRGVCIIQRIVWLFKVMKS